MALDVLTEAQSRVLLEVRPGREHVGPQEAGVALLGLIHEQHIGLIPIRSGQVVLGGDVDSGHRLASSDGFTRIEYLFSCTHTYALFANSTLGLNGVSGAKAKSCLRFFPEMIPALLKIFTQFVVLWISQLGHIIIKESYRFKYEYFGVYVGFLVYSRYRAIA